MDGEQNFFLLFFFLLIVVVFFSILFDTVRADFDVVDVIVVGDGGAGVDDEC